MSSSTDWMPNGGAPLLPKVSPYCVPERQMELKRRPTLYDIRGSGWQMRHYKAPIDAEVPWERVHFWPSKDVHVITEQEVIQPPMPKMTRTRTRTVARKGPKVVKAPPTLVRKKKVAPKFSARYDYWRVFNYVNKLVFGAQADNGALEAAPADAVPTTASITDPHTLPGAIAEDEAAADVDAQTESAADDEAQPSLLAAIFKFGVDFVLGQRKRAHEDDDDVAGDAKRRRVGSDAQAPSRAEARPAASNATTTGATVPRYHMLTAVAAQRRDRRKPKPSRALCPPPTDDSAAGEGNTKVATARPIAGRPTRKRADTPDPRVGTPPPSQREASPVPSTPTSSPSSSRASKPERERSSSPSPSPSPSPAAKSAKSKSSSKSKDKSFKSKSSSDAESSSSKSKSSSKSEASSSKFKSSSSTSKSSSGSKSSSRSKSSSSKAQSSSSKAQASSSKTQSSSSKTQSSSRRSSTEHTTGSRPRPRSGTEIMLYPHFIYWNRDDKLANPWDPRCAAAPDPRFPWAPSSEYWANARTAPIAPLPDPPSPPSFKLERAPVNPLYPSSTAARRHRSPSPVREREPEREEVSGAETEVESGGEETDVEE